MVYEYFYLNSFMCKIHFGINNFNFVRADYIIFILFQADYLIFTSPEPKAPGELLVWEASVVRPSSVHTFKRLLL